MFKPQKVLSLKDALKLKIPKTQGIYYITEKIEGWFVYIGYSHIRGHWGVCKSSNGRAIPSLEHMTKVFNLLPKPHEDCILIAEVTTDNPFHITNGILNRSVGNYKCENPIFYFHDIIFINSPFISSQTRYHVLQDLEESFNKDYFKLLPILHVGKYNRDVWQSIFETIANKGGEGIVAKREDSIYLPGKRTSDLLKLKLECTVDCLADRLVESYGEKGNASLTLISKRKNGTEVLTVISKHEDQDNFRNNPLSILGKVVEIKGMEEYEDGQIRQPIFKHVRLDKLPTEID